jgi:predicted ester cyclase
MSSIPSAPNLARTAPPSHSRTTARPQRPEELVRRLIEEGFNQGRLEVLEELLDPEYREHENVAEGVAPDGTAVRAIITSLRTGFPDLHLALEELDGVADRVWARIRTTGTHRGPFMGIPPTGRTIDVQVMDLVRVRNGRIVEHWGIPDHLALLDQLGVAP